ncbi:MAG: InlB B-repeat-containing protein [Clostridia bacterium]|nr:InlB B-repeat-containing protein [Clostridia bacterium]
MRKRLLALMLVLMMIFSIMPMTVGASVSGFTDFPTGWSKEAMTAAVNNGLLVGVNDSEIKPQDNLTRAEFATIVTRAFGAKTVADISAYTDVAPGAWYYEYIAKAVKMEAMQGKSASTMEPEANITREEVFTALARVLVLESSDYSSLSRFNDGGAVSEWAKPYLSAMAAKGYVNGDEKGYVNPQANITREEFAQVMHNMIKRYITTPGTYAEVLPGITVVRCGGVTVTGTVQGDLVIGDGAMTDAVNLSNVTINGRLLTRGGTMTLKTTTTGEGVVVKNVNGVTQFMNYRTENVFAGIRELTKAEFLKPGGSNFGNGTAGGTSNETLKFFVDDELYATVKVKYGTIIGDKLPEAPSKEGYTFKGWYRDIDGESEEIGKDTEIKVSFDVYAVWEAKTYDLKFNPDNGDPIITLTGTYDQAISVLPTEPTKPGFTFGGWFDANGNEVDEFTVVKGEMQLTAKWNPIPPNAYAVTFKVDGATYATIVVEHGDAIGVQMPSDPTKTGHTFVGWEDQNGNPVTDATVVTESLTVTAVFDANDYTLTFDPDNGDSVTIISITYGQTIGAMMPLDPTKTGYTFLGWKDGDGNPVTDATVVTGQLDIVAIWELNEYTLTFNPDNGDTPFEIFVTHGDAIGLQMPADPTKSGWIFAGWEDQNGNPITSGTVVTEDLQITTKWQLIPPPGSFSVIFKVDGATYETITVTDSDAIGLQMPSDPTKAGHTFLRWEDENGNLVTSATTVAGNMIVNAVFTANEYTLTFDPDNGDAPFDIFVTYGDTIGLQMPSDPTKAGHTFLRWEDQNGNPVDASTIVTGDLQITATWELIVVGSFTVTFKVDGTTYETITVIDGDTIGTLPTNPTKTGHTFLRWEDENGNLVTSATTVAGNMVVNAVFEAIQITVGFKVDSAAATPILTTITRDYGWTLADTDVTAPTLAGYVFQGWIFYDGTPVEYGVTQFTEDVTLYAKWAPGTVEYTVKHNVQKIDGTYEIITETKNGTTGADTEAEAKTEYAQSHDTQSFSQKTIQSDGSTVVEIYYNLKQFTVIFEANGGLFSDNSTKKEIGYKYGEALNVRCPLDASRTDYLFKGWYSNAEGTGDEVVTTTVVKNGFTLYAKWELIPANSFTVTFKVDGETYKTIIVSDGDMIDAQMPADPTKTGYKFLRWEDEDGNVVDASYVVTENVIATAIFEIEVYNVRFFNGAEAVAAKQLGDALDVEYNNKVAFSEYPADAILAAENVKAYGYTKKADWASFYNNEKHEVYAQWMYVNPETGEWELFDENVTITQDTDVHLLLKRVFFMVENDRLPQAFQVQAHYVDGRDGVNPETDATRLRDTGKDLSASLIKQVELLMGEDFFLENEEKIFNKLAEKDLITADRQIKISKLPVKITTVITVEKIEQEVKQYMLVKVYNYKRELKDYLIHQIYLLHGLVI